MYAGSLTDSRWPRIPEPPGCNDRLAWMRPGGSSVATRTSGMRASHRPRAVNEPVMGDSRKLACVYVYISQAGICDLVLGILSWNGFERGRRSLKSRELYHSPWWELQSNRDNSQKRIMSRQLHPDKLIHVSNEEKLAKEEELKKFNVANENLLNYLIQHELLTFL